MGLKWGAQLPEKSIGKACGAAAAPRRRKRGGGTCARRRTGLALGALLAISALLAPAGRRRTSRSISSSPTGCLPSHPLQKAMEDWGSSVKQAIRRHRSSFAVFPAQQLGKAFDHYDMARDGIADVTYINPGYQPGRFPIIGAGELPFLMANAKGGSQALDAWYRKYAGHRDEGREVLLGLRARLRARSTPRPRRSWCRATSRA